MKPLFPCLLALLLTACSPDSSFDGLDVEEGDIIAGQFVIGQDLSADRAQALGLEHLEWSETLGAGLYGATRDEVRLEDLLLELTSNTRGEEVLEENVRAYASAVNDPYRSYQWNMDQMSVEAAWGYATGDGIVVAVVDTGVSTAGEDTPAQMLAGHDFADDDDDPTDVGGHGTHVAGTISQATNNGRGVVGMAPDATILPVRVLGSDGSGSSWDVANGIVWAVDNGADVINLSLGGNYPASIYQQAVRYAADNGVVVVAASGNEYRDVVGYPAAYEEVIAVGATGSNYAVPGYSNTGPTLDLVAPGGTYGDGILQETLSSGTVGYAYLNGTSMAAPHVSALAALLLEAGAEPADVQSLMQDTARDLGDAGWDETHGYGLIDPVAALAALSTPEVPDEPEPPAPDVDAPTVWGVTAVRDGGSLVITWSTDEPASSDIEFDSYGVFAEPGAVTEHRRSFTVGVTGTYRIRVRSADSAGNEAVGSWRDSTP